MTEPDELYYWIQVCSTQLRRRANAALTEVVDLTATQLGALFIIHEQQACLLKELAEALHVNGSAITTLASRLEQRKLVVRERSPEDGRAYQLTLTDAGRNAVERAKPRLKAMNYWLREGFTPDELAVVLRFLTTTVERAASPLALGDSHE
ncbi:MAG: MarR family transcriptional regulator [Myxococcota bacterium]